MANLNWLWHLVRNALIGRGECVHKFEIEHKKKDWNEN